MLSGVTVTFSLSGSRPSPVARKFAPGCLSASLRRRSASSSASLHDAHHPRRLAVSRAAARTAAARRGAPCGPQAGGLATSRYDDRREDRAA
eukprot:scaffold64718_cov63-Phaeocystis_antarctica.AAC.5